MASIHTIQRATIDLQLPTTGQAEAGAVREWCVSVLLEELDAVLSETCPENQVMIVPALSLDLTFSAWNEPLRMDQKDALRQQIRQQLVEQTQPSAARIPLGEYRADILLWYLQHGTLPEIYTDSGWTELKAAFRQANQQNRGFQTKLLQTLSSPSAFQRWLSLTEESSRYTWLDARVPVSAGSWQEILVHLQNALTRQRPEDSVSVPQLLQAVVGLVAQGVTEPNHILRTVVSRALPVDKLWKTRSLKTSERPTSEPVSEFLESILLEDNVASVTGLDEELVNDHPLGLPNPESVADRTVAVPVAGLVLVANFLPLFLRELGLIDAEKKLVDVRRLPMLLYFIATGETQAEEWQLVLPKLLCGLPLTESCDTFIDLSDQERQEVHKLLTDLIEHWGRLKTTTPDGLRATFLQRTGRLTEKDALFTLSIPEETVDILLSFIPWSFRYVRFSWMPKLLIVEWGG